MSLTVWEVTIAGLLAVLAFDLALAIIRRKVSIMRSIKKTLDPNNILNPGKVFN